MAAIDYPLLKITISIQRWEFRVRCVAITTSKLSGNYKRQKQTLSLLEKTLKEIKVFTYVHQDDEQSDVGIDNVFHMLCSKFIYLLGVAVATTRKGEIDTDLPLASPTVPCTAKHSN